MYNQRTNPQISSDVSYQELFDAMQDLIMNGMKKLLPPDFDFQSFNIIAERSSQSTIKYGWIIYQLLERLFTVLSNQTVTTDEYQLLQLQTQKLQAEIRNHIKLEQEIKLYIDSKSRTNEKQRQECKQIKQYVQYLQNKLKGTQKPPQEKQQVVPNNLRASKSNLNLFKALLVGDSGGKQIIVRKDNKSLNRNDSQRSNSLQMFLSPKIPFNLNLNVK